MEPPKLFSTVEFFLSASNLRRADVLSASDPFAVVSIDGTQLGKTEVINDNDKDPAWTKRFTVEFHFEAQQMIHVEVSDFDGAGVAADPLGQAEFPLGRLMAARGQTLTLSLVGNGSKPGGASTLTVRAAEVSGVTDELRVVMRCAGLPRMNFFGLGSSDPFVRISRIRPDGAKQLVYQSESKRGNLNPLWPEKSIKVAHLCNGDPDLPLEVEVFDEENSGARRLMGAVRTSLNGLLKAAAERAAFQLVHPSKPGKAQGTFSLDRANIVRVPTLLDYLRGGLQINLTCAVDFTGSNGDPRTPSSLHYINPSGQPNEYLSAIQAVGAILLEYDTDKRVPLYGFGGSVNGATRHCFALTFNDAQPEVDGVDGMVAAYRNAFNYVGLSGPTYFEQVIRTANEGAQASLSSVASGGPLAYNILLLLTDGVVNDIDATASAIIESSHLPLSIVIVGVGAADFSAMEFLDSDDAVLTSGGRKAARDCVQFVPYRSVVSASTRNAYGAGNRLAAEVLAEIPDQVVGHFMARGTPPPPPLSAKPVALPVPGSAPGGSPSARGISSINV